MDFCARRSSQTAHSLRPCRDLDGQSRRSTVLSVCPRASVYLDHNLGYAAPIAALLLCAIDTWPPSLRFSARFPRHCECIILLLSGRPFRSHRRFTSRRGSKRRPVISACNDLDDSFARRNLRLYDSPAISRNDNAPVMGRWPFYSSRSDSNARDRRRRGRNETSLPRLPNDEHAEDRRRSTRRSV